MTSSPTKAQVFRQRLGSTLVLWAVVLIALFASNPTIANTAFLVIISTLGVVGFREYANMVKQAGVDVLFRSAIVAGLVFIALEVGTGWSTQDLDTNVIHSTPAIEKLTSLGPISIVTLFFLWLTTTKLRSAGKIKIASLASTLFGWFYVFWLLSFIAKIYYLPNVQGTWFLLYFILVTKFSDLGAYSVGSIFGKHKMAPNVSPGKTWEGFVGAIVVSTLISVVTVSLASESLAPIRGAHAIILGILLSVFAVVGDLVESLLKRETGVKDSGALFPGIGGCLDLIDSLLFNAPLFYLYCRLTVAP